MQKIENGEIVWIHYFTSDDKVDRKEEYKDGKLSRTENFTYKEQYALWEAFNAEGVLVSKKEMWYNEDNQIEIEESGYGIEKYYYDNNQRLLCLKRFDFQNNLQTTTEYSYIENYEYLKCFDLLGILQSLVIRRYNDVQKPIRITYFRRPEEGKIVEMKQDGFEEFFEMIKSFNFDIEGNEIKTKLSMDFLESDHVYEYDEYGNEVLNEEYEYCNDSSVGSMKFINGYYNVYDKNNMLIKNEYHMIRTDWDQKDLILFEYVLNENGLVAEKITDSGVVKIVESFNYDVEGKLISYVENRNDFEDVTEVSYDNYGNKIFEIRKTNYDGEYEEEITEYEIEYY